MKLQECYRKIFIVSHKTDSTAASLMCTDYDISFIHYLAQHTHINGDETGSAVHKRADIQSFYSFKSDDVYIYIYIYQQSRAPLAQIMV